LEEVALFFLFFFCHEGIFEVDNNISPNDGILGQPEAQLSPNPPN
jgi:hypothetical protein